MSTRILRLPAVCQLVGLSRSSILRLEAAGKFPKKFNLSVHAVGWYESEIQAWIAARSPATPAAWAQS